MRSWIFPTMKPNCVPKNALRAADPTKAEAISQPRDKGTLAAEEEEEEETKTMRAWRRRGPKKARQSVINFRIPLAK